MAEWMDWDSLDRLDKLGVKGLLASEIPFLVFTTLAILMSMAGTILHWIPETIAFFLLGSISYKVGFRSIYFILFSIYIFSFFAYVILLSGQLYAIILTTGLLTANLAGFSRERDVRGRRRGEGEGRG